MNSTRSHRGPSLRNRSLAVVDLGRTPYRACWSYQQQLLRQRILGEVPDVLLLTEHEHVYTLGTAGDPSHLLATPAALSSMGVSVVNTDRGGDITYHGPGQLVAYPILDLGQHRRDLHWYLRALEECAIRLLARFGLEASRSDPYTGVWVGDKKICAIGVRTRRWVTMHGLALNVNTDLSYFASIIPCGIAHRGVTSMADLLGVSLATTDVARPFVEEFAAVFDLYPDHLHAGLLPLMEGEAVDEHTLEQVPPAQEMMP